MKTHTQRVKLLFATLLFPTLILVFPNSPAANSLEDGIQAYKAGDGKKALEKLKPLAEQGNAEAQFQLGHMHSFAGLLHNGEDDKEALKWLRKAAEQGHIKAQFELGNMYQSGLFIPKNGLLAVKWLQKAAEQGHAEAQFYLGEIYNSDASVLKFIFKNNMEAVKWYRKAAEQGHALAQLYSGHMYDDGRGVPQNYKEAAKWYRGAAEQGNPTAQFSLGVMYYEGKGVPQDYVQAHKWFNLSAVRIGVRNRDITEKKMTATQVAEAQKLAREWKPKLSQYTLSFRRSR